MYNNLFELYSIDNSKIQIATDDKQNIYFLNLILLIIYYILLIIFIFIRFPFIKNFKNIFLIGFLLLYPFIIFNIQTVTYNIIKSFINHFFQNIYLSSQW